MFDSLTKFSTTKKATLHWQGLMIALACAALVTGCSSKSKSPKNSSRHSAAPKIINYNGIPSHYQVQSGDTVSKIANRYGLNWREVSALNHLDSNHTIYAGQWLTLHTHNNRQSSVRTTQNAQNQKRQTTTTLTNQSPNRSNTAQSQSYNPSTPLPTASITARPVSVKSQLLGFSYPVGTNNAVVRRFGTPTNAGATEGMFFSGKEGDMIMAVGGGTIIHADTNVAIKDRPMVMIQHDDGYVSSYFDVKNIQVRTGQQVSMGQTLGTMITQTSSGVALFEFRMARYGSYIDPVSVLR